MISNKKFTDCRKKNSKQNKLICKKESLSRTKKQWLKRLAYGPNKKQAEIVNIWLSIFAVNARNLINPHWILNQIESIENWQFSYYENLLYSQITNPGLLQYFNGFRNKKNNPNENLGRELLELYTLGEGNFTEEDVKNTARALTGLKLNENNIVEFSTKFHDDGKKLILGKESEFELKSLINWLSKQSSTAENITKRFCNYLLGEEINLDEIGSIVNEFKENDLSLPYLYKSISKNGSAIIRNT